MRASTKKRKKIKDDSLFGLLSAYKSYNTYLKVLISDEDNTIVVLITSNPKYWYNVIEERFSSYYEIRRLEIGTPKLIVKYINPVHLFTILGPILGLTIPNEKAVVTNQLNGEGYYIIETSLKYKQKVLLGLKKILNMNPQKKYEILEKCIAESKD